MKDHLPAWTHEWLHYGVPALQILVTLLVAWLLRLVARRLIRRVGDHYTLPPEMIMGARRVFTFVVYFTVLLIVLNIVGVSATVLWTAFTGFAAVGAVAFFAAWSVLSNIFCTLLIFTTRPFRLHDYIELLENGEKPGLGAADAQQHVLPAHRASLAGSVAGTGRNPGGRLRARATPLVDTDRWSVWVVACRPTVGTYRSWLSLLPRRL